MLMRIGRVKNSGHKNHPTFGIYHVIHTYKLVLSTVLYFLSTFRSIVLLGVLLLSLLLLEQSVGSLYSFILLLHRNGFSRVLPNETARINTLLLRERIKASRNQTLFGDSVSERLVLIADR